jgi:hypothetical protein
MSYLAAVLFWLGAGSVPHHVRGTAPKVSECFKVHDLLKVDDEHYWAKWSSSCPYTIDSVYVMVGFTDHSGKKVAEGVWSMYQVKPGAGRVNRFTAPLTEPAFQRVRLKRITTDSTEALAPSMDPVGAPRSPNSVGDPGATKVQ